MILPDPIQPKAVTKPTDRFRCLPYCAVITASACVLKRRAHLAAARAAKPKPGTAGYRIEDPAALGEDLCSACSIGPQIEAAVGAEVGERQRVERPRRGRPKKGADR